MARRRRKRLPDTLFETEVQRLSHEGRGIGDYEGKVVFIEGALLGETVKYQLVYKRKTFLEAVTKEVQNPSDLRVTPPCEYAELCGGCSLQHMQTEAQIDFKERTLKEMLAHAGCPEPEQWLPPLTGDTLGYRRKARLGVKNVPKKGGALVGFREKRSSYLADIESCKILAPTIGESLTQLREFISQLDACDTVPQLEIAGGDEDMAIIVRHLEPMTESDQNAWTELCQQKGWQLFFQPKGPDTVHRVWPPLAQDESPRLQYRLDAFDVELLFHPTDFTQVNASINQQMVPLALNLLDIQPEHRVLDLFCGLGNFTIPLATKAAEVVGVEGSQAMVERGYENAAHNNLSNVSFFAADLTKPVDHQPWYRQTYDRVLLDPARSGALEVIEHLSVWQPEKIVYVSCNPATLARDVASLVQLGYRITSVLVMDMFTHTDHVESMMAFEKVKK
ncbi:MAG: 23S rRNA (uracil(1939)-C(5))-methyltransferase RlmD [Pseudomonadota bacterium]|nr:23S rRNA (uracil(1939)-C(5))-methyltransferase RlmD [Pseudomonadota bacterium]